MLEFSVWVSCLCVWKYIVCCVRQTHLIAKGWLFCLSSLFTPHNYEAPYSRLVLPSLKLSLAPGTTDLAYLVLLWVSYLPCSAIPPLYALWSSGSSEPSSSFSFSEISNRRTRGEKEHQRRWVNAMFWDVDSLCQSQKRHNLQFSASGFSFSWNVF